jgi:hypothetical protein
MGSRLVLAACLLVPTVCNADSIGSVPIPPAFWLSGFGSSEVYRGQTFTTPSGAAITADSLSVFLGGTFDSGAVFHVLLTEVDTSAGIHPTNVLFESGTLTAGDSFSEFVVDLGGLPLQPGREYAWILDHFVVGNPVGFVSMSTGLGDYAGGVALRFVNGPSFPPGTRQDHFASNWLIDPFNDFAFQLNITQVPEPSAFLLFCLGLGGLRLARHRRRPT